MPVTTRRSRPLSAIKVDDDNDNASPSSESGISKPTRSNDKSRPINPPTTPLPTPSLASPEINYTYAIARGEMGVLTYEPYKSLILPFWAFRTVSIAQSSCTALWSIFRSYVDREDFVGADMTRKFIQMGMTRAKRYANHKGGRKYDSKTGELLEKWSGDGQGGEDGRKRKEKEEASELFKGYWRRCIEDERYGELKRRWMMEKKAWEEKGKRPVMEGEEADGVVQKEEQSSDTEGG